MTEDEYKAICRTLEMFVQQSSARFSPFVNCDHWILKDGEWLHEIGDKEYRMLPKDFTHCPFCGHERAK